jgi:hypothetical protein
MKKITRLICLISFIFFSVDALAQFPVTWTVQFQHTATLGFSNEGRRIAEDASGNIFELSDVVSDIDPNGVQGSINYHYVNITKYSSTGSILAKQNIDIKNHVTVGYNNFSAFGLEVDAAGNVYVGFALYNNTASFDVVLAKFNNTLGNIPLFMNSYSTSGSDVGIDMKVSASGTIYAIVKSVNITTAYTLIKSNPSGTAPTVVHSFPGNSVVLNSLAIDASSRAYVAGYILQGITSKNAYVAEVNTVNNSVVWSTTFSGKGVTGDDIANKITVGVDGKIYTVGTTYQGAVAGNQALVLKNSPGNPHFDFALVLRGAAISNVSGVQINASESGWVYVGSVTNTLVSVTRIPSNGIFTTPSTVSYNPVPTSQYTTINSITLTSMKISSVKNIYITGTINASGSQGDFSCCYFNKASVVFGNALVKNGGMPVEGSYSHNYEGVDISLDYGKADVYWLRNTSDAPHNTEKVELVDLNVPSPLRESNFDLKADENISLYPNPAVSEVTLQADNVITTVEVMDMTGNRVLYREINSDKSSLDISTLLPGIYLCRIQTEQGSTIKRLAVN